MLNYKTSDEKGYVCGIKVIDETDDIILISNDGVVIRIRACDIRVMSRYATGVRVMRINGEDNRVVAFTRAEHDDDEEIATIEEPTEEELKAEADSAMIEENGEKEEEVVELDDEVEEEAEEEVEEVDEDEEE